MKLLYFLIFLIMGILYGQESKVFTLSEDEYAKRAAVFKEGMRIYKELCSKDSLRAVNDFKTDNKLYTYNIAPNGSDFPAKEELRELLKNNNISWGGMGISSDRPHAYITDKCYQIYMNFYTREKYGENFIDALVEKALLSFVQKKPSIIFSYNDHLDWIYDNNDKIADEIINQLFHQSFSYPKRYHHNLNERSYSDVKLILNRENYTMNVEGFVHHIEDDRNKKFIPHFEKWIKNFIKTNILTPSKESGLYSGFKNTFRIYYK